MTAPVQDQDLRALYVEQDITSAIVHISPDAVRFGGLADIHCGVWDSGERQEKVSIKFVRVNNNESAALLRRFRREIKIWGNLQHPNILPLFGLHWTSKTLPGMVSPWCERGDVNSYLKSLPKTTNHNELKQRLLHDVARGLDYLHNHGPVIVHGDLKGANVLVSDDGVARICDFGLSKMLANFTATLTTVKGTVRWMAPELLEEYASHTTASDIWAFACVIVEVFSGGHPFASKFSDQAVILALARGERPERPKDVSDSLWALARRCLSSEPHRRPSAYKVAISVLSPSPSGLRVPSNHLTDFRTVLRRSKRIVAICGPGISASSGASTLRPRFCLQLTLLENLNSSTDVAAGSLPSFDTYCESVRPAYHLEGYGVTALATLEGFVKDPSLVWQFYHYRREVARKAQPNAAHYALAQLMDSTKRALLAPACESFKIITRNTDGLALRAHTPFPKETDPDMIEIDGRVNDTLCTRCGRRTFDKSSPICPALVGTERSFANPGWGLPPNIPTQRLPHCKMPECGGLLRPGVVWFEEDGLEMDAAADALEQADLCLAVDIYRGYDPFGFLTETKMRHTHVAIFSEGPLDLESKISIADFYFAGPYDETIPRALAMAS